MASPPSVFVSSVAAALRMLEADRARRHRPRRAGTLSLNQHLMGRARWVHRHPTDSEIAEAASEGETLERKPYRKET